MENVDSLEPNSSAQKDKGIKYLIVVSAWHHLKKKSTATNNEKILMLLLNKIETPELPRNRSE